MLGTLLDNGIGVCEKKQKFEIEKSRNAMSNEKVHILDFPKKESQDIFIT